MKYTLLVVVFCLAASSHVRGQSNPIPNPGFELWHYDSFWLGNLPDGWQGPTDNGLITKSTDPHSGSYALAGAVNMLYDSLQGPFLWYSVGDTLDGFHLDFTPDALEGYLKLNSVGHDIFDIDVFFFQNGGIVGAAIFLDSNSTEGGYQHFSVPPDALYGTPDSATIYIAMRNDDSVMHAGSNFVLDDIALVGSNGVKLSLSSPAMLETYPNPCNTTSTIRYSLRESDHIRMEVMDMTGKHIALLKDEVEGAGDHEAMWDASKVASGQYFVRLSSEHGSSSSTAITVRH